MANRKYINDSITELPNEPGLTAHGLMINVARMMDKDQPMTILFSLSMPTQLEEELENKVAKGEIVSHEELVKKYVPNKMDIDSLVKWLGNEGFVDIKISPNGTGIYATAKASQIEKSLNVDMVRVTKSGLTYIATKNAPSLPEEVAGSVHAIIGLQPFRHANKHKALRGFVTSAVSSVASPTSIKSPPYLVADVLKAYSADGLAVSGRNQVIAILIDTFPDDSDTEAFWNKNGIPVDLTRVEKINVKGGQLPPTEGEETLDTQWTSGIANMAKI
jgi:kumamolisin